MGALGGMVGGLESWWVENIEGLRKREKAGKREHLRVSTILF